MRNFKKLKRITVTMALIAISLLIFPGIYDRYLYSIFYPRSFELAGEKYRLEYPARVRKNVAKGEVFIEKARLSRNIIILDSEIALIRVHSAEKSIDQEFFENLCKSSPKETHGIFIGFDGEYCFARTELQNALHEFRYLDFPGISFKSKDTNLDLYAYGFKRVDSGVGGVAK